MSGESNGCERKARVGCEIGVRRVREEREIGV